MERKFLKAGDIYTNNQGYKFVLERKLSNQEVLDRGFKLESKYGYSRYWEIRFIVTGYRTIINSSSIFKGSIKDRFQGAVYDVGIIGNVDTSKYYREYFLWQHMLLRVYDNKYIAKSPSYGKVKVSARWCMFENFLNDLPTLEGYEHWKAGKDYQLDKDKYSHEDNKRYSKETCCFISESENLALRTKTK